MSASCGMAAARSQPKLGGLPSEGKCTLLQTAVGELVAYNAQMDGMGARHLEMETTKAIGNAAKTLVDTMQKDTINEGEITNGVCHPVVAHVPLALEAPGEQNAPR